MVGWQCRICGEIKFTKSIDKEQGLKDHQIQQLVNAIRDAIKPMIPHQCLRTVISTAAMKYLEGNDLRIDKG